jgi:hypothetical protein
MATASEVQEAMRTDLNYYNVLLDIAAGNLRVYLEGMTANTFQIDGEVSELTADFDTRNTGLQDDIAALVDVVKGILTELDGIVLTVESLDTAVVNDVKSRLNDANDALPTAAEIDQYSPEEFVKDRPNSGAMLGALSGITSIASPSKPITADEAGIGKADRPVVDIQGIRDSVSSLKSDINSLFQSLPDSPVSKFIQPNFNITDPDLTSGKPDWSSLASGITGMISGLDRLMTMPDEIAQGLGYLDTIDMSEYHSALLDAIERRLTINLQGNTGLSSSAGQAAWQLMQERRAIATQGAIRKLRNEMGKTGFGLPPGKLGESISTLLIEHANVMLDTAREIAFKDADIMQANMAQAITAGTQLELGRMADKLAVIQMGMAVGKTMVEVGQVIYQMQAEQVKNKLSGYGVIAQLFDQQARFVMLNLDVYKAKIDVEKSKIDVNATLVKQYEVELSAVRTKAELYKIVGDLIGGLSQLETAKVQIFKAATDAFLGQIQAVDSDVKRFEAEIRGKTVYVEGFKAENEGFMGEVAANKAYNDSRNMQLSALSQKAEMISRNAQSTVALLSAEVERMRAIQAGNVAEYQSKLDAKNFSTQITAEGLRAEQEKTQLSMQFQNAKMQILASKLSSITDLERQLVAGRIEGAGAEVKGLQEVVGKLASSMAGIAITK